jgi:DNA polymerase phi
MLLTVSDHLPLRDLDRRLIVAGSLFLPSSSPERKHWGLLLLAKVLATAPSSFIQDVFTTNTVLLLVNHLKVNERYLHKSAKKAAQALQVRANREPSIVSHAIKGLVLGSSGLYNFDKVTKTKTVAKLLTAADLASYEDLVPAICETMEQPHTDDGKQIDAIRRVFADILVSVCSRVLGTAKIDESTPESVAQMILDALIGLAYSNKSLSKDDGTIDPPPSPECRAYLRSRIRTCLDESLQSDLTKYHLLRHTIHSLKEIQYQATGVDHAIIEFDTETQDIFDTAFKNLRKIMKTVSLPTLSMTNVLANLYSRHPAQKLHLPKQNLPKS